MGLLAFSPSTKCKRYQVSPALCVLVNIIIEIIIVVVIRNYSLLLAGRI